MNRQIWLMIVCGVVLVTISMGLRQSFGVFLTPVSDELGIGRQSFGLVIAVQVLLFGIAQPVVGAFADRLGTPAAIVAGSFVYAAGLISAGLATNTFELLLSLGITVGLGLTGVTQVVVLGALGKAVPNSRRSMVFGTVIAAGSFGMFLFVPVVQAFVSYFGWRDALLILGLVIAALGLLSVGLKETDSSTNSHVRQSLKEAITEASSHRGYVLLTAGFFVCGFHVTFIGTHLPAFLTDNGLTPAFAATALGLIGLANVGGAYLFGALGDRYRKKDLLVWIYFGRAVVMAALLIMPLTEITVIAFGMVMGVLWLGTVPLTSGIVAQVFGTQYFATLYGVVFMSHQIGSFLGAWLGGYIYDVTGSYDLMWMLSVGLGIVAAMLHWPIDDKPLARLATAD